MDLGCGNGALLESIREKNHQIMPFGVDRDETKIGHGQEIFSNFGENLVVGNISPVCGETSMFRPDM